MNDLSMPPDDLLPWEDSPTDTGNSDEIKELADNRVTHQDLPSPEVTTPNTCPSPKVNTGDLWKSMELLYEQGLSMIWGRAEAQTIKGKVYDPKTPLVSTWSSEPERRLSLEALAKMMHNAPPGLQIAPIIICGKGSGNLWAIDIDIKHWPGIDVRYFAAIRETFPDLWGRLRIHKTPSGGFHLLYRIEIFVPGGNKKLAYKIDTKEAGIETRAHGGYIMAPPGMGYEVYRDVPIPAISVEDHHRLIMLAQLFNEQMPRKAVRSTKKYEEIYNEGENPFQHYNGSQAATELLLNHGWEIYKDVSDWIHFTRPGKDHGISASFNKSGRFYHFFTTSTEFDGDKTYDPAAVRCLIEFENDYKKMYPVLVKEGFGGHKAYYEDKMVKKATETGKPLPANFSKEAKEKLQVAVTEKNTKYPHGIFWEYNPNSESYIIQRELLDRFLNSLGLHVHHGEPVVIEGQFVRKLKEKKKKPGESEVYELIKSWIREEEDTYLRIAHEFSKFWQASGEFIVSKLQPLDEKRILKSNPKTCYKFFRDKIVEITAEGKSAVEYESKTDYLIWADERIDRDWNYVGREDQEKSIFGDFIRKAISGDPGYVNRVLGFMCKGYKVSSESYLVAFMEPTDASKGGGTGKNFTFDMLRFWTSTLTTNGQAVKKDVDQLIQNWNGEKLVHLSDLPKWVNLSDLKHIVTDDSQRKLLYKDISNVKKEDMPTFVLSGQFGLNTEDDGGVKGRLRQLAFSGYFSRLGRDIRSEYGGDVPDIFTEADWDGYYSFLADCVCDFMKSPRIELVENVGLWLKGWDMRYSGGESYLRDALEERVQTWARNPYTTPGQIWEWYEMVCKANGVGVHGKIKGIRRLYNAIKEYGENMDMYEFDNGSREQIDGIQQRVVKIKMLNELGSEENSGEDETIPF